MDRRDAWEGLGKGLLALGAVAIVLPASGLVYAQFGVKEVYPLVVLALDYTTPLVAGAAVLALAGYACLRRSETFESRYVV